MGYCTRRGGTQNGTARCYGRLCQAPVVPSSLSRYPEHDILIWGIVPCSPLYLNGLLEREGGIKGLLQEEMEKLILITNLLPPPLG